MDAKLPGLLRNPDGSPVGSPEEWIQKRDNIRLRISPYLGRPNRMEKPPAGYRILNRFFDEGISYSIIEYLSEPDEPVRAYLLVPPGRRRRGAAVLCLHGTSPEAKETQIGSGESSGQDFARILARKGFITLAPDHLAAGERLGAGETPFDTDGFYKRHPRWSAMGKAIWDGRRALDILERIDEVDPKCLGVAGHSLGGHGGMFLAAFDERVAAAVSSCGLTLWQANPRRFQWTRGEWYVYFPALREAFATSEVPPFDLHEVAALIAPRAFLNISGLCDMMYGNNEMLGEAGVQLSELYSVIGCPDRFFNFLFDGGHHVPDAGRALMVAWFERWLTDRREGETRAGA